MGITNAGVQQECIPLDKDQGLGIGRAPSPGTCLAARRPGPLTGLVWLLMMAALLCGSAHAITVSVTSIDLSVTPAQRSATTSFTVRTESSEIDVFPLDLAGNANVSIGTPQQIGGQFVYMVTINYVAPTSAQAGFVDQGLVGIDDFLDDGQVDLPMRVRMQSPVVPPTSSLQQINIADAVPGTTVTAGFSVFSDNTPISISTDIGSVDPTSSDLSGATVTFSYVVPLSATTGDVFDGTILVSDTGGAAALQIPVRIAVTDVPAPTSSVQQIIFEDAVAGTLVRRSFEVSSDNPPIGLQSDIGSLSPTQIAATTGTVEFTYQIPADAVDGDEIRGSIEVSDQRSGRILEIPVSIVVGGSTLGELDGLTGRQRSIAGALDNACSAIGNIAAQDRTAAQQDLLATCSLVGGSLAPGALLDGLAPQEVAAQGRSAMQTLRQQQSNVAERMIKLRRSAATGVDVSGLAVQLDGRSLPMALLSESLGGAAGDLTESGRLGVFVNGSALIGERRRTTNESGIDYRSYGLTLGADYRFTPNTFGGIALGITRSDSDFKDEAGGVDVDGYSLSLYASHYYPQNFYVDAVLTVGKNEYDTVRTVFSGPGGQRAKSSPDGNEFGLGLSGGYDFVEGPRTISVIAGANYLRTRIDGFRESASNPNAAGAGSLLTVSGQTVDSLTTELAVQMSYAYSWQKGVIIPSVRLGVEHEHMADSRNLNARFTHDPTGTRFSLKTDDPDRTYFNLGAGVSAQFAQGRSAFIFVDTLQGRSGVREHRIDAGLRMEF